jgi:hypothetical protein
MDLGFMKISFGNDKPTFGDEPDPALNADKTEFQTFVVNSKTGEVMDGFSWGFTIKDGKVNIHDVKKLESPGKGSPLDRAAQAWDKQSALNNDPKKRNKEDKYKYKNDDDQQAINLHLE